MSKIAITYRKVPALIPYARNSRTHSEEQVAQIAASIKEFGFTNPILLDGENGLIAGHGRLLAARKLGLKEVPTIELAGLTETQKRAYIIADNKLALNAGWDHEVLKLELESLIEDGFDTGLTGFTAEEIVLLDTLGDVDDLEQLDSSVEGDTKAMKLKFGKHEVPLTEAEFSKLENAMNQHVEIFGMKNGLIVAGHQRTRAAKIAGLTRTPVCFLTKKPSPQDEIRFNQLHNGTDLDSGLEKAVVAPSEQPGFFMVDLLDADYRSVGATTRAELARMLTAYGNWGGCVASLDGVVLSGASYALAASAIGMQVRTCYVDAERAKRVKEIFSKAYGRYDYQRIKRNTYNQTFAQMFRLREGGLRANHSPTYKWLLSRTPKETRIFDFGCGQGDYVKQLKKQGYDIQGLEFFRRKGNALDVTASQQMIDALLISLKTKGLFDLVICDYVLNSVDSQQAENDVMACVSAFCKPGGRLFISGRRRDRLEDIQRMTQSTSGKREAEFMDKDGISGLYRAGEWFFQKFHSPAEVKGIIQRHFRDDGVHEFQTQAVSWQATFIKGKTSPDASDGISREFDLPLPNGRSFNRQAEVLEAMRAFL